MPPIAKAAADGQEVCLAPEVRFTVQIRSNPLFRSDLLELLAVLVDHDAAPR